jgi:hypothetical protein
MPVDSTLTFQRRTSAARRVALPYAYTQGALEGKLDGCRGRAQGRLRCLDDQTWILCPIVRLAPLVPRFGASRTSQLSATVSHSYACGLALDLTPFAPIGRGKPEKPDKRQNQDWSKY